VIDENTLGAGYWGNLTRNLFLKQYLNGTLNETLAQAIPVAIIQEQEIIEQVVEETKVNIFEKALTTEKEFSTLQE
jgi:hypothetical protein